MIYAIVSDIHSNLEALQAVRAEIDRRSVDSVLCLGDLVGYNADPEACVREVLSFAEAVVRGNHDKAVVGLTDLSWFNSMAREAALWTRDVVAAETLDAIRGLAQGPVSAEDGVLLCHGSPADEDEYLLPGRALRDAFDWLQADMPGVRVCFHGHTHLPQASARARDGGEPRMLAVTRPIDLDPERIYILNPGSVGQPRDGNPRASFGILDTGKGTFTNIRVGYAFRETQRKVLEAGLPPMLAQRLGEGR